ncbi:MAG: hypothetical protein PHU85_18730 [Phycisphaerae bacterium]|nr:hypothetical protein [Phycisphaerae bacterium]
MPDDLHALDAILGPAEGEQKDVLGRKMLRYRMARFDDPDLLFCRQFYRESTGQWEHDRMYHAHESDCLRRDQGDAWLDKHGVWIEPGSLWTCFWIHMPGEASPRYIQGTHDAARIAAVKALQEGKR